MPSVRRTVLALSLVVCSCAVAQQSAPEVSGSVLPPPKKLPPATARITGTVFCADTHRPARGAMVMVIPVPSLDPKQPRVGTQAFVRVASNGTYTAAALAPGEYTVIAMLPGYLSDVDDMASSMDGQSPARTQEMLRKIGSVTVRADESAHLDLTIQRGASVSGRVLYADGSPASQVTMDVQDVDAKSKSSTSPEGDVDVGAVMRTMFMHQSQGTDDQGHFRIAGLRPGKYRVAAVQASASPMGRGEDEMGFLAGVSDPRDVHFFSGDTIHKKSAKTYELRSGDDVSGIDITLPVDAFHRIEGRLSAKDGRPINSATLTLTDSTDGSLVFQTALDRTGAFIFPAVPSGTYTLAATQAKIVTIPDGYPAAMPALAGTMQATNAFADGNTPILVEDSDVPQARLALTEVPLPPDAGKQKPSRGSQHIEVTPPPE
jgi:hypothetical protein